MIENSPSPEHAAHREKKFFDQEYRDGNRKAVSRFHRANEPMHDLFEARLLEGCSGTKILEMGCGRSWYGRKLVLQGADLYAVDISETAVQESLTENQDLLQTGRLHLKCMDCEAPDFPADSFDLVFGSGILHHLNLEKALAGVNRILKPGGRFLFCEPLGMNPMLNLYRRMTPALRSPDEHPLVLKDLAHIRKVFPQHSIRYYSILAPLGAFCPDALQNSCFRMLWKIDGALCAIPGIRNLSWVVFLEGVKPRQY